MLRKLFLIGCLTFSISAFGQSDTLNTGKNEVKINFLYFIPEIVEINYERALSDETAIGLAASYWFGANVNIEFIANPYFRLYFGDKYKTSGFFIEGNAGVIVANENYFISNFNEFTEVKEQNVYGGAGVAAGGKFLTKNGFIGEAFLGIGRIFGSEHSVEVYPRAGILLGKRF